jgi:AraC-like DNA-binding protein
VFLSGLIFLLSLKLVPYIIGYAGFYMAYPWLDLAPFDLSLGFGPLLYLYIWRLTQGRLPARWFVHLTPLLLQFAIYAILFLQPLSFKRHFEDTVGPHFNTADNLLDCLSFGAYVFLTWRVAVRFGTQLLDRLANPETHRFRSLRLNLSIITLTFLAFTGAKLWTIFVWPLSYYQMFPFYLLLTTVIYAFGFVAFQFAQAEFQIPVLATEPKETDWSALAAQFTADLESLTTWRDPFLSVATAAKALGTSESRLSRAINVGLGMSFSNWINGYRIEHVAQELLRADPSIGVMEIAQRCGFNSKASFHRWFRAIKGCTPTEFRAAQSVSALAPEPRPAQPQCPPS